jgi:glycosyltransferase involved in cell wall biosynthesis
VSGQQAPLVSVVTPVYNGGDYLRECIESVIAQSYTNWRYTIVNNRSTDDSLEIAQHYASLDPRVRVHDNVEFLPIIDNHNHAYSLIDRDSIYCKPLMADDRLYPECIETMVSCALTQPSIGLVCSLASTENNKTRFDMRPADSPATSPATVLSGNVACRTALLEDRYFFGLPTTMLIRADLIRSRTPFYDPVNLHADVESCYDILQESDFAFIHQALAFMREHEQSQTSRLLGLESNCASGFYTLTRYGRVYLNEEEFRRCYRSRLARYYGMLAVAAVELRGRAFWEFHRRMLIHSGAPLDRMRLSYAIAWHVVHKLVSPRSFVHGVAGGIKAAKRKLGKSSDSSVRHH